MKWSRTVLVGWVDGIAILDWASQTAGFQKPSGDSRLLFAPARETRSRLAVLTDIDDQNRIVDWTWTEFPGLFYALEVASTGQLH